MEEATLREVVRQARAGERAALADLYRLFYRRVLGLCRYLLGSSAEAEDAASEIFARLPQAMTSYDSTLPFPRWLFSVTSHYCLDLLRRRRREQLILEPHEAEAIEAAGGNVEAHVSRAKDLFIEPGVVISGQTKNFLPTPRPSRYARPRFYLGQGVRLAAALLTGFVLYCLFPFLFAARLDKTSSALRPLGIGFLVLVATPIAAIVAGITLIGIPLALLALAAWLAGLYLAKIVLAALVGQAIRRSPVGRTASFALDLLIGLAIVFVAINLPYLGGWISFLVLLLGLGLAFTQLRSHWQRPTMAT